MDVATRTEPTPKGKGEPVTPALIEFIKERNDLGRVKYGEVLHTDNGRDALVDALQESIDCNQYLMQELMEVRLRLADAERAAEHREREFEEEVGSAFLRGQNSVLSDVHKKLGLGKGNGWDAVTARINELVAKQNDDWQDMVRAFHEKFDATRRDRPTLIAPDDADLRAQLIIEEVSEFIDAQDREDIVEMADALVDLIYVAIGTAVAYGINLRPIFRMVHEANMRKAPYSRQEAMRAARAGRKIPVGKIMKPDGWVPPNVEGEIRRQQMEGGA